MQKKVATTFFAIIFVLLLLAPVLTRTVSTPDDAAKSPEVSVSTSPTRIQEGDNTTITVEIRQVTPDKNYTLGINVANPNGTFSALNMTVKTDVAGIGEKTIEYWKEFTESANTDYVGTYVVTVKNITTNETLAETRFTVGLTHQLKHRRNQTVLIKGSGYKANENVTINIKHKKTGTPSSEYPKNINASDKGIVNHSWQIPEDAIPGVYTVSITNATSPGTVKNPPDSQDFYVEVWTCQIRALNLANETVANLAIEANNETVVPESFQDIPPQQTNKTGWASFMLATGNYTFKAFWKQVKVGNLPPVSIVGDIEKEFRVQLSNLKIIVIEEASNETLPFIKLTLEYNDTIETAETNITGTALIHNLFTNVNYTVKAERYGLPLPLPPVEISPQPQPNILTVEFPLYTVFVHVEDSKKNPAEGVRVEAYEWSSGLAQSKTTDSNGNVTFSLTFGRYRVKVYNGTFLLDETIVDVTENQSSFNVYLSVYNIDFTVEVVDYFGNPVPNAMVQIERKTDTKYEAAAPPGFTGPDGHVTFSGILGGDSRISIYIGGQLSGTKDLYLTDLGQVTFNLNRYVAIAGYAVETSQFVTAIAIALLIIASILALTHKRVLKIFLKSK